MIESRLQSSTAYPVHFFLALSVDHTTGATGKAPAVTISKNGAAFGAAAGAVSEIGNGWYALAGNAVDRATLGELLIHATATGCDPRDFKINVVGFDPFDQFWGIPGFNKLQTITSGAVTFINPVSADSTTITITRGDSYLAVDGRSLDFTLSGFPSLVGATILFSARSSSTGAIVQQAGSVVSATVARVELTAAKSATLSSGTFDVQATLADGSIVTLVIGTLTVQQDVTP